MRRTKHRHRFLMLAPASCVLWFWRAKVWFRDISRPCWRSCSWYILKHIKTIYNLRVSFGSSQAIQQLPNFFWDAIGVAMWHNSQCTQSAIFEWGLQISWKAWDPFGGFPGNDRTIRSCRKRCNCGSLRKNTRHSLGAHQAPARHAMLRTSGAVKTQLEHRRWCLRHLACRPNTCFSTLVKHFVGRCRKSRRESILLHHDTSFWSVPLNKLWFDVPFLVFCI